MAEEKSIVLKIETITDQAVMEAYGKTLDSVLGAYEDNIALIAEYNAQIKANKEQIKAIEEQSRRFGKTTERQAAEMARLTAENGKLAQAKAELVQITKNQEKVDTTAIGSMENQSQILGKLRMAWRKMTDEQKNANQGMLQTIQQLDGSLKQADGSIGNFQRNVGNYKGAIGELATKFPMLGGAISKFAGPAGVISLATGAFNVLKSAMASTQATGDAIEIEVAAWRGTWDRFLRMIATADFSNFIEQLTGAYDAAKGLASVRDEMFEKENSIRLLKAEQSVEEQQLLMTMRDQTKSEEERIKAGKRYQELVKGNAQLIKKAYNELAEAELDNIVAQTGANKEALRSYIKDYATPKSEAMRRELVAYQKAVKDKVHADDQYWKLEAAGASEGAKHYKAIADNAQAIIDSTPDIVKKFAEVTEAYGKSGDAIVSSFVNAWERALQAEANALQSAQRAATTTNSLIAKEAKKAIVKVDTSGAMTQMVKRGIDKIDTKTIHFEFKDMLAQMAEEAANDPALDRVAESRFARWLGVSDEQLKSLKDHALQAAGQIFNSIKDLSEDATQRRLKDELDAIEKEAESEKAILESKVERGILSQKEYEKKLAELDEQTAERKEQANKEAFEKQKRWNIAQALMNAALAITKLFTEGTAINPATWVALGITAATTAAEIAVIASQKYARGGELRGPSHAHGGIKGFVGNQHIEAEGGEVIINKRSSAKHRKLLSLINSDNGWGDDFARVRNGGSGRFFARGGMLGGYDFRTAPLPDTNGSLVQFAKQQADNLRASFDAINRRIDNIRVLLPLSDIEAKFNEKKVHISRAGL